MSDSDLLFCTEISVGWKGLSVVKSSGDFSKGTSLIPHIHMEAQGNQTTSSGLH